MRVYPPLPGGQEKLHRGQIILSDTSESALHPLFLMTISPLFSGEHAEEIVSPLVFLQNVVRVEVWQKMRFQG